MSTDPITIINSVLIIIGFFTVYCFVIYLFWCIKNIPYRFFCKSWLEALVSLYTYTSPIVHAHDRLKYGCSWDDAWNFDNYLLKMLPVGLQHLRNSDFVNISEKDFNDMIGGIEAYNHIYECTYDYLNGECPYSHVKLQEDFEHSMALIAENFTGLWI